MNNQFRGIASIIGDYGVGKTIFSLTTGAKPQDVIFINDDVKTPPELPYGKLINLRESLSGLDPYESYEFIMGMIEAMEMVNDTFDVIIWDTWTRFGTLCQDYVKKYPGKFRANWSPNGKIKSGEMYREARNIELSVMARLKAMAKIVILTFHPKQLYINNNAVYGRSIPEGTRAIAMGSDLRIWLTHDAGDEFNPGNDAPVGLVLKNIAKTEITENGVEVLKVLPKRLRPCTWDSINSYYDNPVGLNDTLSNFEIPSEFELSIIEGTLSEQEKRVWLSAAVNDDGDGDLLNIEDLPDIKSIVAEHNISGVPPVMLKLINEKLAEAGENEIDMGQMNRGLK